MRELKLMMSVSLDGFVSGPAGEIDWMFSGDQAAIAWKVETAWNASLHLMGSRTFQGMASFWPTATSPFAAPMNQIPKAVCSAQGPAVLEVARASLAAARATEYPAGRAAAGRRGQLGQCHGRQRPVGRCNRRAQDPGRQTDHCPRRRRLRAQPHRPQPRRRICVGRLPDPAGQGRADLQRPAGPQAAHAGEHPHLPQRLHGANVSACVEVPGAVCCQQRGGCWTQDSCVVHSRACLPDIIHAPSCMQAGDHADAALIRVSGALCTKCVRRALNAKRPGQAGAFGV